MRKAESVVLAAVAVACAWSSAASAEERSVTLPRGTKVAKLGAGHFRFLLPNTQTVEMEGLDRAAGSTRLVVVTGDPNSPVMVIGDCGTPLKSQRLTMDEARKLSPMDYVTIEHDPIRLPVTIRFTERKSVTLPRGTKAEKLGAGLFRFVLPDKQAVEVRGLDLRTGSVGRVAVRRDPGSPTMMIGDTGSLLKSKTITMDEARKLSPMDYVVIGDTAARLPVTIVIEDAAKPPIFPK